MTRYVVVGSTIQYSEYPAQNVHTVQNSLHTPEPERGTSSGAAKPASQQSGSSAARGDCRFELPPARRRGIILFYRRSKPRVRSSELRIRKHAKESSKGLTWLCVRMSLL